jgi:nucleotide-binding universal stress UspA family protein
MTTHGRTGLNRVIFGSVTEAVLGRSPVPVWLVRALAAPSVETAAQVRWVVPLDGSVFAEEILPHAKALAQACGATLVLMHVVVSLPLMEFALGQPVYVEGARILNVSEAEMYLGDQADRLRREGVMVETVIREGNPAEEILAESRVADTSLVLMATHGRTGLGRLRFGSVALDVLRRGSLPLVIVRPAALAPVMETEPSVARVSL